MRNHQCVLITVGLAFFNALSIFVIDHATRSEGDQLKVLLYTLLMKLDVFAFGTTVHDRDNPRRWHPRNWTVDDTAKALGELVQSCKWLESSAADFGDDRLWRFDEGRFVAAVAERGASDRSLAFDWVEGDGAFPIDVVFACDSKQRELRSQGGCKKSTP